MTENTEGKKIALKNFILPFACFVIGFIVFTKFLGTGIGFGIIGGWVLGGGIWGMYYTRDWFGDDVIFTSIRLFFWLFVSFILGPFIFLVSFVRLILTIPNYGGK